MKLRLDHNVYPREATCPHAGCKCTLDRRGLHAITCTDRAAQHRVHNKVREILYQWCRRARLSPKLEVPGLTEDSNHRPADVYLPHYKDGRPKAIDVGVASPYQQRHLRVRNPKPLKAAKVYQAEKRSEYANAKPRGTHTYTPFIIEATGAIGTDAAKIINTVSERIASNEDTPKSVIKQRFIRQISCCVIGETARKTLDRDFF